jgi:hypothetical protein
MLWQPSDLGLGERIYYLGVAGVAPHPFGDRQTLSSTPWGPTAVKSALATTVHAQ